MQDLEFNSAVFPSTHTGVLSRQIVKIQRKTWKVSVEENKRENFPQSKRVLFYRLMKIQRKMYEANKALSYFVTHNWNFKNENFINLSRYLKPEDKVNFDYHHFFTYDVILFIRSTVYGFRKYLMNLKDEDLEKDRKFVKKLTLSLNIFKFLFMFLVFYVLYVKFFHRFSFL